ncbi:MAG TPA: topology modulation protein [Candidatus Monoglobus merdigallinarum]|uniref:Topology modulation protein n=1 Tax=Candidatus Monoglobus merdigallinarum TaxID=2838698 RepID=A0A9D1PPV6_9FIRM|nr:topology modulation protein [Candidatus Monoglobus merdigallinarum]
MYGKKFQYLKPAVQPRRIAVIGFSGSGKSTLAIRLGSILGVPPVHLDSLFWLPGWRADSRENMREKLKPELEKPRWIIEGNYTNVLYDERLNLADTIIMMDINRFVCFKNCIKRRIMYSKQTRPDMTDGCDEKLDFEFAFWVLCKGRKGRKSKYEKLSSFSDKNIYIFRSRRQAEKYIKDIKLLKSRNDIK